MLWILVPLTLSRTSLPSLCSSCAIIPINIFVKKKNQNKTKLIHLFLTLPSLAMSSIFLLYSQPKKKKKKFSVYSNLTSISTTSLKLSKPPKAFILLYLVFFWYHCIWHLLFSIQLGQHSSSRDTIALLASGTPNSLPDWLLHSCCCRFFLPNHNHNLPLEFFTVSLCGLNQFLTLNKIFMPSIHFSSLKIYSLSSITATNFVASLDWLTNNSNSIY